MNENNVTPEVVRESIIPKSDQLNADDLVAGPITVTVTGVRRGDREQPIIVDIEGRRPYKPCKTMRRVLIAAWGDDPKRWVGQKMTLYCNPDVTWAGVRVGGIRISHLSGLDGPRAFLVTQSRGRRAEVTIYPVEAQSGHQAEIENIRARIAAAENLEALSAIGKSLKERPQAIRDAVREAYAARRKQLSAPAGKGSVPRDLAAWITGIESITTLDACTEFRASVLPDCPADIRTEVEMKLVEHETKLMGRTPEK